MKRINKTSSMKRNCIRNLFSLSYSNKQKVRFTRRQKIHLILNKLRQYSCSSKKDHRKKVSQTMKLDTLKQRIVRNPENYNIVLDKQKLFEGKEFDISFNLFLKDNTAKFYQIQIITPKHKLEYIVLTSRGNIGSQPVFNIKKFKNLTLAIKFFKNKYFTKTKEGYLRSKYTYLRQFNSSMFNKKLIKKYLISQLV